MSERILEYIGNQAWALLPERLEQMLHIVNEHVRDDEALASRLGERQPSAPGLTITDGVASIALTGPIFRRANLFTMISGGTSTELLARNVRAALNDTAVSALVLAIDSPGGEAAAISELSRLISDARGQKPIVAHVDGLGASGAYWIAASADEIYVNETARVGSIGVVSSLIQGGGDQFQIVSRGAPLKRPNIQNSEHLSYLQALIDDLESVFHAHVAEYRGVTVEHVTTEFGRGGLVTVDQALAAGMVDDVASFDEVLNALISNSNEVFTMTDQTAAAPESITTVSALKAAYPELCESIYKAGVAHAEANAAAEVEAAVSAERERVTAILELPEAEGKSTLALKMACRGLDVETAKDLLAEAPASAATPPAAAATVTALDKHMASLGNPAIAPLDEAVDDEQAELDAWVKSVGTLR